MKDWFWAKLPTETLCFNYILDNQINHISICSLCLDTFFQA